MAEATDGLSAVVNAATQLVKEEAIHVGCSRDAGGTFSFFLSCEKSVVKTLCVTGVTLYGMYTASKLLARAIDGIVNKGLEGHRTDQAIGDIQLGSLHVMLTCFTDERFLEVWTDYESGRIKERLQREFTESGIQLEGFTVGIKNLEEVNKTKIDIERRRSLSGRTTFDTKEEEINKKLDEIKNDVDVIKANQIKADEIVRANFENFKREIIHELTVILRRKVGKPQPESHLEEMIVIGGNGKEHTPLAAVEKTVVEKDHIKWVSFSPMNVSRSHASSVVIGRQIYVLGGGNDNSIETLDVDQRPLQWVISKAVLPFCLRGHSSVVYQGKLISIGGYNSTNGTYSDEIHEIILTAPYSTKLLGKLPKPIGYHGAELVKNTIYIFGGMKDDVMYDDILAYDLTTNECRIISKLPYPLCFMSTVQQENKVILIGGGKELESKNSSKEVIMYDTKTGKFSDFPSMNRARRGCSAVVSGDAVVVFGGYGVKEEIMKSVECYDASEKNWKDLPRMKEGRAHCIAVVFPQF